MVNDWTQVRHELDGPGNFKEIANSPWYSDAEYDRFSDQEFKRRHGHARELMAREGLEAILFSGSPNIYSHGSGVLWGAGLNDDRGMCQYLLLPAAGDPTLFYPHPGCHIEAVRQMVSVDDVRGVGEGPIGEAIARRLRELGLEDARIGVTAADRSGPEFMGVAVLKDLTSLLPKLEVSWEEGLFHELTYRKGAEEIRALTRAGEIVTAAHDSIRDHARPGVREYELAGAATGTIVGAGGKVHLMMIGSTNTADPRIVFPNPNPSGRVLAEGDIILTEVAGSYLGYSTKVGHPIVLGEPPHHVSRFFDEIVQPGFEAIRSALRPGAALEEMHRAASFFREHGAQSRPIVAHGIDLITAGPMITTDGVRHSGFDATLQPGMVINIEITPINADGTFGMFLSRTFVIEEEGVRELTPYPLDGLIVIDV